MKTRRGFIGSLLGLIVTPKLVEKVMPTIKPETILGCPVSYVDWSNTGHWHILPGSTSSYDGVTTTTDSDGWIWITMR